MKNNLKNILELNQNISMNLSDIVGSFITFLGASTFGYRKFFYDGTSVGLSNNVKWTEFYYDKFIQKIIPEYEKELTIAIEHNKRFFLRLGNPDNKNHFFSALYDFNIWNSLSFYIVTENGIDGYYFASDKENDKIIENYLNNIDKFEYFSPFFKEKLASLIPDHELKKIALPTVSCATFLKPSFDAQKHPAKIPIKNILLTIGNSQIILTKREAECLEHLAKGKTAKLIARVLGISPRTVEYYIEKLKEKGGVHTKNQLIDLYYKSIEPINLFNLNKL